MLDGLNIKLEKIMISSTGFLDFPDGNKFFEDNLLDEDDWSNELDANLSAIYPSPSSSLESNDKNGYDDSTWLIENDLDVWLANDVDPQFSVKQEPMSPGCLTWTANDSSATDISNLVNTTEILQPLNKPIENTSNPTPLSTTNNNIKTTQVDVIKTTPAKTTVNNKPNTAQIQNTKVRPILPSVAPRKTTTIKPCIPQQTNCITPATLNPSLTKVVLPPTAVMKNEHISPTQSPQIIKLENGQYYVAPVFPTDSKLGTALPGAQNAMISRPCLKRPSDIKTETLFTTAKDVTGLKNMKRQQRMMKNRESACLSRQRKKEHLVSLEQRVAEMTEMNSKLKQENESLKQRIQSLECENKELKVQPTTGVLKRNAKKTTILLALFLLFSMNIFRFADVKLGMNKQKNPISTNLLHRGRTLLNYDNSNIYEDYITTSIDSVPNNNKKQHQFDILDDFQKKDPVFRLKKVSPKFNKFGPNYNDKNLKRFQQAGSLNQEHDVDCGDSFNKTDLNRINKALEGLAMGIDKKSKQKVDEKGLPVNTTEDAQRDCNKGRVKKRIFPKLKKNTKHTHSKILRNYKSKSLTPRITKEKNITQELASLIQKNIRRQPDTFYVVSLLQDMMILPATNFSSNQRPKVTFLLPAYLPTNDTKVKSDEKLPILQIECNVVDIKLLHLESTYFSENLLTQLKSF